MTRCQHCGVLIAGPEYPDWRALMGGDRDRLLADNEVLLVTRGSLRCARSALAAVNAQDYYHNNGAAQQEIKSALERPQYSCRDEQPNKHFDDVLFEREQTIERLRAELALRDHYANEAAAAERERCAKIVEAKADKSVLAFAGCVAAAIRKGEP